MHWTPLHVACRWGHDDVAEMLVEHGADEHHRGVLGKTPKELGAHQATVEAATRQLNLKKYDAGLLSCSDLLSDSVGCSCRSCRSPLSLASLCLPSN